MHTRTHVTTGTPWEPVVGYSRAVRAGPFVWVSGTTAIGPDGTLVGRDDPAAQARQALANIAAALERAGAALSHVVRTRIYVRHMAHWEAMHEIAGWSVATWTPGTGAPKTSQGVSCILARSAMQRRLK